MQFQLENSRIRVTADTAGAELVSIFDKEREHEILWNGAKEWWPRRAPVLFPIVGKLNNNELRMHGRAYQLPQHGFARDSEFSLTTQTATELTFTLSSGPGTLEKFPFDFKLTIKYHLNGNQLSTEYSISNPAQRSMYFSIGAHPGFVLRPGEKLSDYYVEFEHPETLDRHLLDQGLFTGKTERVVDHSATMDLTDEMMTKDAVVFKDMRSKSIFLKSRVSDYCLKFQADGFPYFGIWAKPGGPFVCLEPWCGMADNAGYDGDLKDKEGIVSLGAGDTFIRRFSVTI